MKLILVIFCVLAVYEAGAFICNSKKIAQAFGALEYCNQHVWIKPINLEKKTQDNFGCQDSTFPKLFQVLNSKQGECSLCRLIVDGIREQLESVSMEDFKEKLTEECKILISSKSECPEFVDKFGMKIYEKLTHLFKNYKFCTILKCSSNVDNIEKISEFPTPFNPVKSMLFDENQEDSQCDTCQKIMETVEQEVKNHASKEEIKKTLLQICPLVPSEHKSECEDKINNLKDEELKDLLLGIVFIHNPKLICAEIHVCSDSRAEILDLFKPLTNFQSKLSSSEGDGGLNRDVAMFFDENSK